MMANLFLTSFFTRPEKKNMKIRTTFPEEFESEEIMWFNVIYFISFYFIVVAQTSDYILRIQFFNHFYAKEMEIFLQSSLNPFEDEILMTCFIKYKI